MILQKIQQMNMLVVYVLMQVQQIFQNQRYTIIKLLVVVGTIILKMKNN